MRNYSDFTNPPPPDTAVVFCSIRKKRLGPRLSAAFCRPFPHITAKKGQSKLAFLCEMWYDKSWVIMPFYVEKMRRML